MHELYDLKEKLMQELRDYGAKGDISASSLDIVDKLAHTVKNLCRIMDGMEEYSGDSFDGGYRGRSYRGSYRDGSYARGRTDARRDSMGRYSGERGYSRAGLADELRDLMAEAPEHTKPEFQHLIEKIER